MENSNTFSKLRITLITLLSVIFFLLITFNSAPYYVIFALGLLGVIISIYLGRSNYKKIDYLSLLIYLIPVVSLGLMYAISKYFQSLVVDDSTKILIPFTMLVFAILGISLNHISKFEIKYIFIGIFIGFAVISLINMILTLSYFGPFHGIKYADYAFYYNGKETPYPLGEYAYIFAWYNAKVVTIERYLIYPFALLLTPAFILLTKERFHSIFNIVLCSSLMLISFLSIMFVVSKAILFPLLVVLFSALTINLLVIFKVHYNKVVKWILIGGAILLAILSLLIFLNAQYSLTGIREIFSSNALFDRFFNSNKYIKYYNPILNNLFSMDKIIGFPCIYDADYETAIITCSNIFVNQFMFGGLLGFLFFILIFVIDIYNFFKIKNIENNVNRYMPLMFISFLLIIGTVMDVRMGLPSGGMVTFLMLIMFGGYYASLANEGEMKDEE